MEVSEVVSVDDCCQRACELSLGDCQRPWNSLSYVQSRKCPKHGMLTHLGG